MDFNCYPLESGLNNSQIAITIINLAIGIHWKLDDK